MLKVQPCWGMPIWDLNLGHWLNGTIHGRAGTDRSGYCFPLSLQFTGQFSGLSRHHPCVSIWRTGAIKRGPVNCACWPPCHFSCGFIQECSQSLTGIRYLVVSTCTIKDSFIFPNQIHQTEADRQEMKEPFSRLHTHLSVLAITTSLAITV